MDTTSRFGRRLHHRRASQGLTLREVAQRAGVSVPYVANLEKGRGNPTLTVMASLAQALEVPLGSLIGDPSATNGAAPISGALPPVLVDYARGGILGRTTQRLADLTERPVDEMREQLVRALAAIPTAADRALTLSDCRRVLDAYTLVLGEPD